MYKFLEPVRCEYILGGIYFKTGFRLLKSGLYPSAILFKVLKRNVCCGMCSAIHWARIDN